MSLREQCSNQSYLPWTSHVINLDNLSECFSVILRYAPLHVTDPEQCMCIICWKAVDTEVESNLKSPIKIGRLKEFIYSYWLITNSIRSTAFYLCQLGSVGASDLIHCQAVLKTSVKCPYSFPIWCFLCCPVKTEWSPLLWTHNHTQMQTCAHRRHSHTQRQTLEQTNSQDSLL